MTKTQTFSKEERGAVHLLYDPDFRDKNDFRQDLRKVSQSPGPGAHRDPLTSYKYVITQNGNFSIPKVNLFVNKILFALIGQTNGLKSEKGLGFTSSRLLLARFGSQKDDAATSKQTYVPLSSQTHRHQTL